MSQGMSAQSNFRRNQPQSSSALPEEQLSPTEAAVHWYRQYARERPDVVALWAFGIGFILGWKLKPW